MKEKIAVDEFKDLILEMYEGFPNLEVVGKVEKVVITKEMRDKLIERGFLIKETYIENEIQYEGYMLGPAALPLVSSWKNEELTNKIKKLTSLLLILTIILVIFGIASFLMR